MDEDFSSLLNRAMSVGNASGPARAETPRPLITESLQAMFVEAGLDHALFGSDRSKEMNVIDVNKVEHDVTRTFLPTVRHHALMAGGGATVPSEVPSNLGHMGLVEQSLAFFAGVLDTSEPEEPDRDPQAPAIDDAFAVRLSAAYRSGALHPRPANPVASLGQSTHPANLAVNHNEVSMSAPTRRALTTAQDGNRRRCVPTHSLGRPLYTPW